MYSGDEYYDDDVTSGILLDEYEADELDGFDEAERIGGQLWQDVRGEEEDDERRRYEASLDGDF